jgi:hypothetical protein
VQINVSGSPHIGISLGGTGTHTNEILGIIGGYPSLLIDQSNQATAPSVPASATAFVSPYPVPMWVTITGGTVSALSVNGVSQGSVAGTFLIQPGAAITLTYTVAPSWTWSQTPANAIALGSSVTIDTTAGDIAALGTQAAGSTGKAADAGHVHPTTGVALTANNLSDLNSASAARTNLGLTGAATASLPLSVANGGTGQTSAGNAFNALSPNTALGDITYGSGANTSTRLAGNTTSTKNFLTQTGNGSVSAAPGWGAIAAADLPTGTTSTKGALQLDGTASDIVALSTQATSVGTTGKAADGGHVHPVYAWGASDYGLITMAFDPAVAVNNATALATAGTLYVIRLHLPVAQNITNIVIYLSAAGGTLTTGQCFAALYQGGSKLGVTADQASAWGSTGLKTMAISGGAVAAAAGDVYVGLWFNGTTGPASLRGLILNAVNLGLAASASRFGTADTGLTTTAPSTMATVAALNTAYWAALS